MKCNICDVIGFATMGLYMYVCVFVRTRAHAPRVNGGHILVESWYERWNIKINEDKTRTIYFSH